MIAEGNTENASTNDRQNVMPSPGASSGNVMYRNRCLQPAPCVAAIRPEDFTVGDGPNAMEVDVEVVEYQGREQAIQARTAAGDPRHLRAPTRLAPGDRVTVSVPPERVLVFAAESPA